MPTKLDRCPYLEGDETCNATLPIIGQTVPTNASKCAACSSLEPYRARQLNYITVSFAAESLRQQHGDEARADLLERYDDTLYPSQGVGSELSKIIDRCLGVKAEPDTECDCASFAKLLNQKGPAWTRANLCAVVDRLQANHEKLGIRVPFVRTAAVVAVKLACRRAHRLSTQNISGETFDEQPPAT